MNKRTRTIESFFQSTSNQPSANNTNTDGSPTESVPVGASNAKESEPRMELNPDELILIPASENQLKSCIRMLGMLLEESIWPWEHVDQHAMFMNREELGSR